ncbi:AfsR/SARP family transcriptional regulator [Actinokineospora diospyrosa]|uniref:DNA-binding transcriptional activator of the SARP family n=1 Tax=Actinokineospora diospyrosa TaxID=103728 RepID=A0ABT1II74_9PSEU|nr:BTAD domain-containing putative transcriptional regulator [Actinokineospora diospyrosa]MCP2272351.1 DNA-binding transcriptional activator of the SARP family [Actinokineospora diospyrosa]
MAGDFRVLGPVEVFVDGRPVEVGHARQRYVLAALLIEIGQRLSVDQLLDRVWGEQVPSSGRDTLYSYLSHLRRVLRPTGTADLVRGTGGYELLVDRDAVDLHRFRRLVAEAGNADSTAAVALFGEASALWRGELCAGLDTPWVRSVRAGLDRQRLAAELDHADLRLSAGRHTELVDDLTSLAARYPWDERLAGQLMLALYRSGRQAEALHRYQELRTQLAEELGTDPGPDVQALHQRILSADSALVASSAERPPVVPRQLPGAPRSFTGRVRELADLSRALGHEHAVAISVIGGAGGIGKTTLALAWAHHNLHRFPDGQLFVDLHGFSPVRRPTAQDDALLGFLTALGVDPDRLPADPDARVALYRSLTFGRRMLVLLDNAATAEQVIPLLPGSPTCTVLVTGRAVLPSLIDRHGAHHLRLDVLPRAEAADLLTARLGEHRVAAEPDAADQLIDLCGRHPLALAIAARDAATRPSIRLAELADELGQLGLAALAHDTDPAASLPSVLSWSLRHLTEQQRQVFALLGVAPGPDIDLPAATALSGVPKASAAATLRVLEDHALLDRRPNGRYTMHDLIRAYATTSAHQHLSEQVRRSALERVVDFYLHTAQAADRFLDPASVEVYAGPLLVADLPAALAWLDAHHPHLLSAQRTAASDHRHQTVYHVAHALTAFHRWRGHRDDELTVWQAAAAAAEHLPDPATIAIAHRFLGHSHATSGRHDQAVEHLHRSLTAAENSNLDYHQAATHHALALAWEQRDDHRALEHAVHALRLFRLQENPAWEAEALNAVGWYAARTEDYDTARDHCEAALALFRQISQPHGEANTLDSLGYIEHQTGNHHRSISHYSAALTLLRELGDTAGPIEILDRLGHAHRAVGQQEHAATAWQEAVDLCRAQGRDADHFQHQIDDLLSPT